MRGEFLNYALTADLFVGATPEDIREMFRRMNSYTVPLNAEEKRHSEFQGEFKWFVYRLSQKYAQTLENIGAFSERALARMQDARLMTEFCYGGIYGIETTKASDLRRLYSERDKTFPEEAACRKTLTIVFDWLIQL
jgi:hypothetical protein